MQGNGEMGERKKPTHNPFAHFTKWKAAQFLDSGEQVMAQY